MRHKGIRLTIDKREDKNTVSHKFKKDFIDLFEDSKWKREGSILEVSCYRGYTTNVLSHLFKQVYAVELDKYALEKAKKYNRNRKNIKFIAGNVYNSKGWNGLPKADVIFIDCQHDYGSVISDTKNAIKHIKGNNGLIVFDDYGRYKSVRDAVKDTLKGSGQFTFLRYMGEPEGSECRPGKILTDWEGVVISYEKGNISE
jgi:SAM-dependent methyltransferase